MIWVFALNFRTFVQKYCNNLSAFVGTRKRRLPKQTALFNVKIFQLPYILKLKIFQRFDLQTVLAAVVTVDDIPITLGNAALVV